MTQHAVWRRLVVPGGEPRAEVTVEKLSQRGIQADLEQDPSAITLALSVPDGVSADRVAEAELDQVSNDWRRWVYEPDER